MFGGKDNNLLREIVTQMREFAALLRRDIAVREAALQNMPDLKGQREKFEQEHEERERQLVQIRREGEERHAELVAQHAAWLAAMDRQTAVLTRIAERLDRLSP
jgi:hypothetical protein